MSIITSQNQAIDLLTNNYHLKAHSRGFGKKGLLLLGNGFDCPSNYLLESHEWLMDLSYRVISFDHTPLPSYVSSQTKSIEEYIEDYIQHIEIIRKTFALDEIQILAHGWGSLFAIEYALRYPDYLNSLILINPTADVPAAQQDLLQLRYGLGAETAARMMRYEILGQLNHPEYTAAITLLKYRHICRQDQWPLLLQTAYDKCAASPLQQALFGPNPFYIKGAAAQWQRLSDLDQIKASTLIISGMYGIFTIGCTKRIADRMPNAQIEFLKNSASVPFEEQSENYFNILVDFLNKKRKTVVQFFSVG